MPNLLDYYKQGELECGTDEAGCGSLAGNLYISAVILPSECPYEECQEYWEMLNDSKKLSQKKKELLYDFIPQVAIDYSVVKVTPQDIDEDNIWQSRVNGFHTAIDELSIKPTHIIVDGNAFKKYYDESGKEIKHVCIKGGDAKYRSIAAASIMAKVRFNNYIDQLHKEYPQYDWINNKGYGTKTHLEAIRKYGITKYHRRSYGICKDWKELPRNFI